MAEIYANLKHKTMKNNLIGLFGLVLFACTAQAQISFMETTWDKVLAEAKAQDKLVFIDVYATWCGPCKMMDKDVFAQAEVADYHNATFINAKFDSDTDIGGAVARQFGVTALPTFLYVDADGNLVARTLGYQDAPVFLENSRRALEVKEQFAGLQAQYDAGERSIPFMGQYLNILNTKGDIEACQEILNGMIKETNTDWQTTEILNVYMEVMNPDETDLLFIYFLEHQADFAQKVEADRIEAVLVNFIVSKHYEAADDMLSMAAGAEKDFKKYLPEVAQKYASYLWMTYYESEMDWDNYMSSLNDYLDAGEPDYIELNAFAWNVYLYMDKEAHIKQGLEMALESVEQESVFANNDTVAALYYKMGEKEEALAYAKIAIDLGKKEGADVSETQEMLRLIKKL
jgi:thiol-disulfide isomerase/thioredoxin